MLPIPSRHRSLVLLAVVVLAQVLLLAVQIKSDQEVRLIRAWTVAAVAPLQGAASWVVDGARGLWQSYVGLRGAHREAEQLREENAELKLRLAQAEGKAAEAERLATLLDFRSAYAEVPMLPARVIGATAVGDSRTVLINRGTNDGVERNMAVITPAGVVGRVLEAFAASAQVMLITDGDSGVGVLLEASRTQGVLRGAGEPLIELRYIAPEQPVVPGERLLTSGQDRIFPKDLPVGAVASVEPAKPFQMIRVQPAARLDRLEEVLVLLTRQELVPKQPPVQAEKTEKDAAGPSQP